MLHHIVFINAARPDNTCASVTNWNSEPGGYLRERFFAAGEERAKIAMPSGYGYKTNPTNFWGMYYMVMNHRPETDSAFIEYTATVDTAPGIKDVTPVLARHQRLPHRPLLQRPRNGQAGVARHAHQGPRDAEGGQDRRGDRPRPRRRAEALRDEAELQQPGAHRVPAHLGQRGPPLLQRAPDPPRARSDAHDGVPHADGHPGQRRARRCGSTRSTTTRARTPA